MYPDIGFIFNKNGALFIFKKKNSEGMMQIRVADRKRQIAICGARHCQFSYLGFRLLVITSSGTFHLLCNLTLQQLSAGRSQLQ